jgi:hypothetical protein
LYKHGSDYVVAFQVTAELGQQVGPIGQIPEMMMRIDDRECRIDDLLDLLRQPGFVYPWMTM